MWLPAIVKSEWELQFPLRLDYGKSEWELQFPLRLDYGRSPHVYVNQRLQIQLELLMTERYAARNMSSLQ